MSRRWPNLTLEERFWTKVDKSGDCWMWTSALSCGYGKFSVSNRPVWAHRLAYELTTGEIPTGMQVDHICRERACVRPDHLRLVTHKQNAEHTDGKALPTNKTSGIRGVYWRRDTRKWMATVLHNGRTHYFGQFDDLTEAENAARQGRIELFTHNDADRKVIA